MAKKITKPVMAAFGTVVSERRRLLGMSQETLAERVGISQESLSRMEKGFIAPRFERLQQFADALECSIPDLFRAQRGASERAAIIEQILSPLPECEQREIIAVMAKIVALMNARKPPSRPVSGQSNE
jgi:transcriptional regulator with XRE-family HTH domain